jgi:hypothetical protein
VPAGAVDPAPIVALVVVALVLVGGGLALARSRRRP